jgi:hypothetical protein
MREGTADVLAATTMATYEAAVAALLIEQRAAHGVFFTQPVPGETAGWPWLATTSGGWYAYAFTAAQVLVSFRGGPWFHPDPARPDGGTESATGPDAELPVLRDTSPKAATFTWKGFRGLPIPITTTLPPVPHSYLTHRGNAALAVANAVERVLDRHWPLADLAAPAIRELMLGLLRPGPARNLHVLPDDAPPAHERIVTALQFLLAADRYAEGNSPTRASELLHSAASIADQATAAHPTAPSHRRP